MIFFPLWILCSQPGLLSPVRLREKSAAILPWDTHPLTAFCAAEWAALLLTCRWQCWVLAPTRISSHSPGKPTPRAARKKNKQENQRNYSHYISAHNSELFIALCLAWFCLFRGPFPWEIVSQPNTLSKIFSATTVFCSVLFLLRFLLIYPKRTSPFFIHISKYSPYISQSICRSEMSVHFHHPNTLFSYNQCIRCGFLNLDIN